MKKIPTEFEGVYILIPKVFRDDRGFFYESFSEREFRRLGFNYTFVQDNHSRSIKNTIRGLHFQTSPGQVKLIRCTRGSIIDVIVDLRPESKSYLKYGMFELSEDNFKQILIPIGFAHGFLVKSEIAEVQYKVSSFYNPETEAGIYWNDPELQIPWDVENPILSKRDRNNPLLSEYLKKNGGKFPWQ